MRFRVEREQRLLISEKNLVDARYLLRSDFGLMIGHPHCSVAGCHSVLARKKAAFIQTGALQRSHRAE
jgi:hypothetical protein